jgi:hypothetical protein
VLVWRLDWAHVSRAPSRTNLWQRRVPRAGRKLIRAKVAGLKNIKSFIPGLRFIRGPLVSVLAYKSLELLHVWS